MAGAGFFSGMAGRRFLPLRGNRASQAVSALAQLTLRPYPLLGCFAASAAQEVPSPRIGLGLFSHFARKPTLGAKPPIRRGQSRCGFALRISLRPHPAISVHFRPLGSIHCGRVSVVFSLCSKANCQPYGPTSSCWPRCVWGPYGCGRWFWCAGRAPAGPCGGECHGSFESLPAA